MNAIGLFGLILLVFTLAIGADPKVLHETAPSMIWIAAVFSVLLNADSMFAQDYRDGLLAQVVVTKQSLVLWVLAKLLISWLFTGGIISVLTVLAQPLYGLSTPELLVLLTTMLIGTAILTLFSALSAALTLALEGKNILIPLITMPFYVPVIIFSNGAVKMANDLHQVLALLALDLSFLIIGLLLLPYLIATALRSAIQ